VLEKAKAQEEDKDKKQVNHKDKGADKAPDGVTLLVTT